MNRHSIKRWGDRQIMPERCTFIRTGSLQTIASHSARVGSSDLPPKRAVWEQPGESDLLNHKHLLLAHLFERNKLNTKHLLHCNFLSFYSAYPPLHPLFPTIFFLRCFTSISPTSTMTIFIHHFCCHITIQPFCSRFQRKIRFDPGCP